MSNVTPNQPWKLKEIKDAKEQWKWSEFILEKLRVETGVDRPETTEEEIVEWHRRQ